ncbi:helix-turn-helix transcriptional regulator [Lactobacillus kefiranofaciens]|uniref:helix-turn-helix domain-containing protein n=1 Tax=Lactobacillus kefiranofaciens TaxID=267818 RepID=UPI0024685598|nr:helix-turn-helix transcriptional regulator [Lactobacillus kefiranofaciens]MDH5100057.1 helix-turn-helix transcriptional regulator [Lactobacillus kefiranofaciens]
MTIGEALKSLRLHADMTQTEMAAGIVTESFYSKVERGVHAIDADVLIKILTIHHFDVTRFFAQISNQQSTEPYFDLAGQIVYAQNKKDLKALDKIKQKIEKGGVQPYPLWLKYGLELAYAWVLHSNDQISPKMRKRIKSLILNENWDRTSYHFLSQAVIFLDIDDAKELVNSAYAAYHKHPAIDTFTLQFVALIAVNYLNCCYHNGVDKSYVESSFKFLHDLPPEPAIGLNKLLGLLYEAIFDKNVSKIKELKEIIKS